MTILPRFAFISAIKHTCQQTGKQSSLMYVEVNHATQVVSLFQGLEAEEHLIETVGHFLSSTTSAYTGSILGKMESNRFGVILKMPVSDCLKIADKIVRTIDSEKVVIGDQTYYPKVIVGVTPLTPEYRSPQLAIAAADEALFQARRTGHSVVKHIEPDDPGLVKYHEFLNLLPVLRKGLIEKSFVLFAQPIVPISGAPGPKKAEVLLRYQDENVQIHLPEKFLSTADLFHVSREIDLYVVHHFCRYLNKNSGDDSMYSLNISGSTVRFAPFFSYIEKEFERFKIDPEQICFEMKENVADRDTENASELMSLLKRKLGCKLSLDDIGIGSSNLANLAKFDVDYMKIDGTYVRAMMDDPYAELVIRFISAAARLFGKKTVAEYVETPEQIEKLKKLGVDFIQGYLTGKPEMIFDPGRK
ncbi:MAG: EAL domain-containing protein [Gammaproteobacteria bacterium]